jgi:hypothetical protein
MRYCKFAILHSTRSRPSMSLPLSLPLGVSNTSHLKRRCLWQCVIALAVLGAPLTLHAQANTRYAQASTLRPFNAVYTADYQGMPVRAKAVRELQAGPDGVWTFTSSAKALFASIQEASEFHLRSGNIEPASYHYKRSGLGRARKNRIDFDWRGGTADGERSDGRTWQLELAGGTQDKLGYQLQMRLDLLAAQVSRQEGQPWPTLRYQIADGRRLREYLFEVAAEEVVTTPVGQLNTIRLERVRDRDDRTSTVWLALDWDFLMVRFEQREEKSGFDLSLKNATIEGRPITGL